MAYFVCVVACVLMCAFLFLWMAVSTWIHRVSSWGAGCFGAPGERAEQPALGSGWASSVAGPLSGCLGSDAGRASQEAARHRQRSLGSDVLQFSLVLDVTQLCATGRSPRGLRVGRQASLRSSETR